MRPYEIRDSLVNRLEEDLVGPHNPEEILTSRPFDVYLTGLLWPLESSVEADEDDGDIEDNDDGDSSRVSVFGQMKPSTMGISFAVNLNRMSSISLEYCFAAYKLVEQEKLKIDNEFWERHEFHNTIEIELKDLSSYYIPIDTPNYELNIKIHIRSKKFKDLLLITATLVNASKMTDGSKIEGNQKSIFQTKLRIIAGQNEYFSGIPDERINSDEDELSTALLYRNVNAYAVGHQCSATWDATSNNVSLLQTTWLPKETVLGFSQQGHPVFEDIVNSNYLLADFLSSTSLSEVISAIEALNESYEKWIFLQKDLLCDVPSQFKDIAILHLDRCSETLRRMQIGANRIKNDEYAFHAFQKANEAMSLQHSWKYPDDQMRSKLKWRPFQLAFWLLTLESVCDSDSKDRDIMDLLWFPTGGGKTEAYLAIIAFGAIYKRLTSPEARSVNINYAIMRYTLRLLTAQQFERASSLILALELIRRENSYNNEKFNLGEPNFSIGLWVGSDATPNNYKVAKNQKGSDFGSNAEQIRRCFCCGRKLNWIYNDSSQTIRPSCSDSNCQLGVKFGTWPISTVDDDIYSLKPTLLIGTVDKFAQVTRKAETNNLFGFKSTRATELIIQDELHLISGPLGTIVGAYEIAFDWLLSTRKTKPKVIGSTATIRRAQNQIRALFNRESAQFPPPGLNYEDSGFAVVDKDSPGRIYVGISNAGRSAKFTLQALAGSLLQSGSLTSLGRPSDRDGYSTLLMYFNNLRELGGAIVQVLDDVPDSILLYSKIRNEEPRNLSAPSELTSTRSQSEIIEILEDLSKTVDSGESIDVVLATNMVSVGVDIPRLGLMQVNGQPKTRSEYIQSTSRVGRADFPGLVVVAHNILKARDRSLFETFASWHRSLYRDVEATSVTPFASRARDKTLKTVLTTMIRHGIPDLLQVPNIEKANPELLLEIIDEIESRALKIDPETQLDVAEEIRSALDEWASRNVLAYYDETPVGQNTSLLQSAERFAQKMAAGFLPGFAWPVMNAMRSVEPSTSFKLKDKKFIPIAQNINEVEESSSNQNSENSDLPPWRR